MSLDPAALQQILLKSGSIKPEELNKWAEEAKVTNEISGSVLVEEKLLTLEQLGGI